MKTAAEAISSTLARMCEEHETPGIQYAACFGDGETIEAAVGWADATTGAPMMSKTALLSCSCTKVLTSILVLQSVDSGAMRLEDSHRRFVPESPYPDEVTIETLLSHSAGVPNPMPLGWIHTQSQHAKFDEIRALSSVWARHSRLTSLPGARVRYSNVGYWLLGLCVERASGRRFAALLQSDIVERLALERSSLNCEFPAQADAARGHFPRWGFATSVAQMSTPTAVWDGSSRDWLRLAPITVNGTAFGGAFATASGYLAVLRDLLAPSPVLLSCAIREKLFTPFQGRRGRSWPMTLGFRIRSDGGDPYFSKPGGGPGFSGDIRVYPKRRLATAWLRNVFSFGEAPISAVSRRLDAPLLG